jgi:hypothetical protein
VLGTGVGLGDDQHSSRGGSREDNYAAGESHVAGARAAQVEQENQENEILDDMDAALQRVMISFFFGGHL